MNILNYCVRSRIDSLIVSTIKRSYSIYYRTSVIHNKYTLLSSHQSSIQSLSNRCFMKKMGLKPIYDVFDKKAAKDNVSKENYTLVYNGIAETYVRCLSGLVVAIIIIAPTIFVSAYIYLCYSEGNIDLKTYFNILLIPHTSLELLIMLPTLFLLKVASYSFISKYVLRIYKHNSKTQYIGVYINPVFPWKNITCQFNQAIKLPDGKNFIVPWHKEYYRISGYKSIILKERFRRPIDYDRMIGLKKSMDDDE